LTGEEAKELMERNGFECRLIDNGTIPLVKHPDGYIAKQRLVIVAGEAGLACHVYREGVILVPAKEFRARMASEVLRHGGGIGRA